MRICATTLTSADHFQHYLPLYIYCMGRNYPDIYRTTFICGKIDSISKEAFDWMYSNGCYFNQPIEDAFSDIPDRTHMAAALRFLVSDSYFEGMDGVMFNDVDLLLFDKHLIEWHLLQMESMKTCYAAHHSARRRPLRPEICGKDGWRGKFERIAGGFVFVTPEWFDKTRGARKKVLKNITISTLSGTPRLYGCYRESDEVMLCDIIKASNLPVPKNKGFPPSLRGVHLGDFKESMTHRCNNLGKMATKMTMDNCLAFKNMCKDQVFIGLLKILSQDPSIKNVFSRLDNYLRLRGY